MSAIITTLEMAIQRDKWRSVSQYCMLTALLTICIFAPVQRSFGQQQGAVHALVTNQDSLKLKFLKGGPCQSELIGPFHMPSYYWKLTDSLITVLGKEKALIFFQSALTDSNLSVVFYAAIGSVHAGGDFDAIPSRVADTVILFQNDCTMLMKPLEEAVRIALGH